MYDRLFVERYDASIRKGRRWLRNVSREDRKAFAKIGKSVVDAKYTGGLASIGGKARAAKAERDSFGRFWNRGTKTKVYLCHDIDGVLDGILDVRLPKGEVIATHSYACIYSGSRGEFRRWAWMQKWPNACPVCEANGVTRSLDDPCPNCLERGFCPRCGEAAWLKEDFDKAVHSVDGVTCPFCEWNEVEALEPGATKKGLVMPYGWECYCWENEVLGGY